MSLTAWFKDYIYIPLGGSRVPLLRHILNLLVVWMFTGLWHGADWTFVIWGLIFFVLLVLEKFVWKKPCYPRLYVWLVLLMTFLLFNDPSLGQFGTDLKNLWGFGALPLANELTWYALRSSFVVIAAGMLGSSPAIHSYWKKLTQTKWGSWGSVLLGLGALILCVVYLASGSFNPFLYFRF